MESPYARNIWTRRVAVAFLASAGALPLFCLIAAAGGLVGSVAIGLALLAFFTLMAVDWIVFRRASPGVPWFIQMATAHRIRRRAYRWSLIRAALDGGAAERP